LNTMSSLADRAGVEFGTEMMEPPPQARQAQRAPAARPGARVMHRRPRRVRVVRRRAS
jgi:hypothetical protein